MRRNFSRMHTLEVCKAGYLSSACVPGGESGSPQMTMNANREHSSYTYNSRDRWKRGRRHLQCEAGRARVPMGQLVRQFGSGQTDRERREKQVGWKVCFTQNSTSIVPAPRWPPGGNSGPCIQSEAGWAGRGRGTQLTELPSAMCQ